MKEIVTIQIGQAGIQIGNICWELFCLEHRITLDGSASGSSTVDLEDHSDFQTFFSSTGSTRYVPRCLHIDLDPTTLDDIRMGTYRELFQPNLLISGKEDASNIYARGYYTHGKEMVDICMERLRLLTEDCNELQGFMLFNSIGGGTGSGLGSLLLQRLASEYPNKTKLSLNVFPSGKLQAAVVEPYNAVLALHKLLEYTNVSIMIDNNALCNIYQKTLDIEEPSQRRINQLVAQAVSSLTQSIRFGQTINADLQELQSNHVPFPRAKFLTTSYAPITSTERICFPSSSMSVTDISNSLFEPEHSLLSCDPRKGKYIACSIHYRGDVAPKDINASIKSLIATRTVNFVDWCPTGFRLGLTFSLPHTFAYGDLGRVMRSAAMLSNTTAVTEVFASINKKFDMMHRKRAYVHWYAKEGMEQAQFSQAREDLAALELDYEQMAEQEEIAEEQK